MNKSKCADLDKPGELLTGNTVKEDIILHIKQASPMHIFLKRYT